MKRALPTKECADLTAPAVARPIPVTARPVADPQLPPGAVTRLLDAGAMLLGELSDNAKSAKLPPRRARSLTEERARADAEAERVVDAGGSLRSDRTLFERDRELVQKREARSAHVTFERGLSTSRGGELSNEYEVSFKLHANFNEDTRHCSRILTAALEAVRALGYELRHTGYSPIWCSVSGPTPPGTKRYKYRPGVSKWSGDPRKQTQAVTSSLRFHERDRLPAGLFARALVAACREAGYEPVTYEEIGFSDTLSAGDVTIGEQRARERADVARAVEGLVPEAARRWAASLSPSQLEVIETRIAKRNETIESALYVEEHVVRSFLVALAGERGLRGVETERAAESAPVREHMVREFQSLPKSNASKMARSKSTMDLRRVFADKSKDDAARDAATRELVKNLATSARIEVEVETPDGAQYSYRAPWRLRVGVIINNNGPEDQHALWTLRERLRLNAASNPFTRQFLGGSSRLHGSTIDQAGEPPHGSKSGRRRDQDRQYGLETQNRQTWLRPEVSAEEGSLADAIGATSSIVETSLETLSTFGYATGVLWPLGATDGPSLLAILRETHAKEREALGFVADAVELLGADEVSMFRATLEATAGREGSNFAARMLRVEPAEVAAAVDAGGFSGAMAADLRADILKALRSDSEARSTIAALRELPGPDGLTVSERLAIEHGVRVAFTFSRVRVSQERAELEAARAADEAATIAPRVPSLAYVGVLYAAGVRRVLHQRYYYELALLPDDARDSWFGTRLAFIDADPPAEIHSYPGRSELAEAPKPERNEALRVIDRPSVGTVVVGMMENPGGDVPVSAAEHAWAIGTAPAELVGAVTVSAIAETSSGSTVYTLRTGDVSYQVEVTGERRDTQAFLLWVPSASPAAIALRSSPTEQERRFGRQPEAPTVVQAPAALAPSAASQSPAASPTKQEPTAPSVSAEVPAALARIGFVLPSRRTGAAKAPELNIEVRAGSTEGSAVIVVHGRATYTAKALLKALGLQYMKSMGGIDHGWWVTVGPVDRHTMPFDFERISVALARDYKVAWPARGPLLDEAKLRWESEAASKQREQRRAEAQADVRFVVDYAPDREGRGVWHTVDAPRAAWAMLKPLGWEYQAPIGECRRGGCAACSARLPQCYYTTDPGAAKTLFAQMTDRAKAAFSEIEGQLSASRATDGEIACALPKGVKLYGYQNAGVAYALARARVLIADEMGLGKTPQSIVTCACDPEVKRVLVLVPASLRRNWAREISVFCARSHRVARLKDSVSARKSETKEAAKARLLATNTAELNATSQDMTWVVCGYEEAMSGAGAALDASSFDAVILDEAQHIKNAKAKRTARAQELWDRARRRYIMLTGTPIENNLEELYTLCSMLAPDRFPPDGEFPKNLKYNAKRRKELELEMRRLFMVRRLKSEVLLDLPEKRWALVELDGPELDYAREAWTKLKAETGLDDDPSKDGSSAKAVRRAELEAQMEVARAMKDRDKVRDLTARIAAESEGSVGFEEISKVRALTGNAKVSLALEAITNKLESMPADQRALVVWAHHDEVAEALAAGIRKAGYTAEVANGRRDTDVRARIVSDFQAGKLDVAVCTIGAMGTGHTMTRASEAFFVEFPWTPAKLVQAEDRIHRIGQKRGVTITYLFAGDTLDVRMLAILRDKELLSESTLDNEVDDDVRDRSADILAYVNARADGRGVRASEAEIAAITRDWTEQVSRAGRTAVRRSEAIYQYTLEEKATMAAAMNQLRNSCDRAKQKDDCGFAAPDVRIGWAMADIPPTQWTDELATLGHKLTIKYRGQLGGELIERKPRPLSTEERID